MATLRKRNGVYFVDYRVKGKRVRKSVGKSKKIAELALKDIELKIARDELDLIPKDYTLEKLFTEYLTYSKTNHAPTSYKRYRAILDNFKRFLNSIPCISKISQLTPKTFEDFKTFRKKESAANKTINIELQTLRCMFNLSIKWGYTKENPTRNVSTLKIDKKQTPRFLSKEECNTLLENCGDKLYPIFFTFLYTGMRKGELENLEWSDIDFERRKIKIRVKDSWRPKSSEREIPINNELMGVLVAHKKKNKQGTYVFNNKGKQILPNSLRKKLINVAQKCGVENLTKLHTLRHTFASHLVMKGVDLPTVKKLMGHADIETTMIYSHLADKHIDNAIEKLKF